MLCVCVCAVDKQSLSALVPYKPTCVLSSVGAVFLLPSKCVY